MDLHSIGQKTCSYFPSVCEKFIDNSEQTVGVMTVVAATVTVVALGYLLNKCYCRESETEKLVRRFINVPRENTMQEMEIIGEQLGVSPQQIREWQREFEQELTDSGRVISVHSLSLRR